MESLSLTGSRFVAEGVSEEFMFVSIITVISE
jgi:hypothetical protein